MRNGVVKTKQAHAADIRNELIESILDRLFTNGLKVKADRLLLIKEDYSGAATVSNAEYLGGFSRQAIRDILRDAIRQESTDATS